MAKSSKTSLQHLESLQGIPIVYESMKIYTMKYHAFADDVNIYLADEGDYAKVAQIIDRYEKVSNSLISASKSTLLGFDSQFADLVQPHLPFSQKFISNHDVQYLGLPLQGVNWTKYINNLPFMTFKSGYSSLDVIERAKGTVQFVSSKPVYRDLVQCMSRGELHKMDTGIKNVFRGIGKEKIYARPKKGGYGLIEMKVQLQGRRAGVLVSTLTPDQDWYTKLLKLKMIHHMAKIITGHNKVNVRKSARLSWVDFLLERSNRFYKHLDWTFTPSECAYIEAWKQVAPRTREFQSTTLCLHSPALLELNLNLRVHVDPTEPGRIRMTPDEALAISQTSFRSLSRLKQEALPPIKPGRFLEVCPEVSVTKRWRKFWKELYKQEWLVRNDFTALHLFNHGSYVPMHDILHTEAQSECHLCLGHFPSSEFLTHLYNECAVSRLWWQEIGFTAPMHLREILAPLDTSFENLRNLNWFVKIVKKVYTVRLREAGTQVLAPLPDESWSRALRSSHPMGR